MIQGVIFDLDGVLVSTDELHYQAWNYLAQKLGIPDFTRKDNERQRGISRMASLEVLLEKSPRSFSEEEKAELAEQKNIYYKKLLHTLTPDSLLPGAGEALSRLKKLGTLTAVGSASKNAPEILRRVGLLPLLDQVSCGLDTTKSKPDPEVFLVAADKLQLPPGVCLVVEDSAAGIQAARAGGMASLAVGPLCGEIGGTWQAESLAEVKDWRALLG